MCNFFFMFVTYLLSAEFIKSPILKKKFLKLGFGHKNIKNVLAFQDCIPYSNVVTSLLLFESCNNYIFLTSEKSYFQKVQYCVFLILKVGNFQNGQFQKIESVL